MFPDLSLSEQTRSLNHTKPFNSNNLARAFFVHYSASERSHSARLPQFFSAKVQAKYHLKRLLVSLQVTELMHGICHTGCSHDL